MRKPEILMPAGSLAVLKVAIDYGADACYVGGDAFGLRAGAKNFSDEDLKEGIAYAHAHKVKVYVTANILAHNRDLKEAEAYFTRMKELKPDALIISDPGLFTLAQSICPEIEKHISTQANNTNAGTFRFWHNLGAKRVVTARELSLAEIAEIRKEIPEDLEIETFVHGAMCISYSGRCLLSAFMTGREANLGACTHPCRWKYTLMEEKRPGEYFPVEENDRGTYIMNSRDLCMIGYIPELVNAGIDSFKIEGRMKTALYVATIARAYKKALTDYLEDPERYEKNRAWYEEEVKRGTYRDYTTGFFFGKPDNTAQIYENNTYVKTDAFIGIAGQKNAEGLTKLIQKNKFSVGDTVEIMKPDGRDISITVSRIVGEDGLERQSAPHPEEVLWVNLGTEVEEGDVLRMRL